MQLWAGKSGLRDSEIRENNIYFRFIYGVLRLYACRRPVMTVGVIVAALRLSTIGCWRKPQEP